MAGVVKKKLKMSIVLPPGRCSYPFLTKTDTGREYSDDAYKFDHLIPKAIWNAKKAKGENAGKTYKQIVEDAILAVWGDLVGAPEKGKPAWKLSDVKKHPIKDLALDPKTAPNMKDYIMMRCKSGPHGNTPAQRPLIVGLEKGTDGLPKELPMTEVMKIKGGDWVEPIVDVYYYTQSGGGVTFGLTTVRFLKPDEPFGRNAAQHLGLLEDVEVTEEGFSDAAMEALAKAAS